MEEARAIALQAAAEQREKLMARAREAEAAKAAAEAADAAPAASAPSPALTSPASGALTTAGTPEVRRLVSMEGPDWCSTTGCRSAQYVGVIYPEGLSRNSHSQADALLLSPDSG